MPSNTPVAAAHGSGTRPRSSLDPSRVSRRTPGCQERRIHLALHAPASDALEGEFRSQLSLARVRVYELSTATATDLLNCYSMWGERIIKAVK